MGNRANLHEHGDAIEQNLREATQMYYKAAQKCIECRPGRIYGAVVSEMGNYYASRKKFTELDQKSETDEIVTEEIEKFLSDIHERCKRCHDDSEYRCKEKCG